MLKPRKRKQRIQMTVLGHQFVVHHPKHGRTPLSNDETNGLYSHGLMYSDARQAPYMQRQALYIASQRHRFACVGVTGLREMSKHEWDTHWTYRKMRQWSKGTQLEQMSHRGYVADEISPWLYGTPSPGDFFFGIDSGVMEPGVRNTMEILKGREGAREMLNSPFGFDGGVLEPGMMSQIMPIHSPMPGVQPVLSRALGLNLPINRAGERKTDMALAMAMKIGPHAVRDLLMERLTVPGSNGERYFISSEAGDDRINDLMNALIKAQDATPMWTVREVDPNLVPSSEMSPIEFSFPKTEFKTTPSGEPPEIFNRGMTPHRPHFDPDDIEDLPRSLDDK